MVEGKDLNVSLDFDGTLDNPAIQILVKKLMRCGCQIYILTCRYDDLHRHLWQPHSTNEDLYLVADILKIPHKNIYFGNMLPQFKPKFLHNSTIDMHIENDAKEVEEIETWCPKIKVIKI